MVTKTYWKPRRLALLLTVSRRGPTRRWRGLIADPYSRHLGFSLDSRNARNLHAMPVARDALAGLYFRLEADHGVGILDRVLFSGSTVTRGGSLFFTCVVEYPAALDAFLPSELTNRMDRAGSAIAPFSDGKGRFEADSLEHAEETETEIGALLQTAYRDLQEMQRRTELWTGVREFALHQEEEAVERLPSLAD